MNGMHTTGGETVTQCERCGRAARGRVGSPAARMMRRALQGTCLECTAVLFLQRLANMYGPGSVDVQLPDALRLPHVRERFAAVMRAGMADARPEEIDWERVIALWDVAPAAKGTLF